MNLLTDVHSVQMSEVVVSTNSPGEQLRWLGHRSRVHPISSSIGSDELMETKCWYLLLQSKRPCEGIKGKKKQGAIRVGSRQKVM